MCKMRLNANTKICGKKVILIPYEAKHVEKYHNWMSDPELQELTASEPLTLDEEYEMQRSWREDENKLTFLVLCRERYENTLNEIDALVGDTNIFLHANVDEQQPAVVAEAEIMIAEPWALRRGYGKEAMLLMLKYAHANLGIQKFEAKIGMDNLKSLNMFQSMQFKEVARVEVFREVTLERCVDDEWLKWLDAQVNMLCAPYELEETT